MREFRPSARFEAFGGRELNIRRFIYFREGFDTAFGAEGRRRWFGLAVVGISAGKVPDPRPVLLEPGDLSTVFMAEKRRFPARVAKFFFGSGFF